MYNLIIDGETVNLFPVSLKEAKKSQKQNFSGRGQIVKATAAAAKVVRSFYRGNEITIHEERHNGWTLVSNVDGSRYFYNAITAEIEAR
jgi:hypothetical protein